MERPPSCTAIADRKALAGKVVVILEDDELVRRATERLLRRFGAEVVAGCTSDEVQEALAARGLAPDCVVADFWLSGEESGVTAAARLGGKAGRPLRTVIVTGDVRRETVEAAAGAGFPLLRKPVDIDSFLNAVVGDS